MIKTSISSSLRCPERELEHEVLVSEISRLLAEQSGYSESDVEYIAQAAKLHDTGKKFIPDNILEKPDKLTDEEYDIVKTHSVYGFIHLIQQARMYMIAAIIALQHHERPEGNGYAGVKNIHAYAKLVAVADVFDALVSPTRPYKEGWSLQEAIDYMASNQHKEFDAIYIDAFIKSLDEILKLYQPIVGVAD